MRIASRAMVLFFGLAPAVFGQRAKVDSIVRSTTLENGLEVIVIRNSAIPFVTLEMVVRAGAFTQTKAGDEGLQHLIEHMLFRRGDGGSFDEEAAKLDASWNGVTSTESVRYFLTVPSKNFAPAMELLFKLIRKGDFAEDALKTERKVVQGELERHASEPMGLLQTEADMLLWEGDGWRTKNPGGNLIALNAATPATLGALYKKFYVPNNAALVIAGNVSDSVAFANAARIFKAWKRGDDPMKGFAPVTIAPLKTVKRKVVTAEVKDVTFYVRWHGPSVTADASATYAADAFSGLVNQRVSQTQKRLVDSGLLDDVSMTYETLNHVGPIELIGRTSADRAVAAAEALGEELSKLVAPDYFNDEDLVLAKKYQQVAAHFALESGEGSAHTLSSIWSSAGMRYFLDYGEKLDAQTSNDITRYVNTYIAGKPMAVNVLISPESWSKIAVPMQRALGRWKAP